MFLPACNAPIVVSISLISFVRRRADTHRIDPPDRFTNEDDLAWRSWKNKYAFILKRSSNAAPPTGGVTNYQHFFHSQQNIPAIYVHADTGTAVAARPCPFRYWRRLYAIPVSENPRRRFDDIHQRGPDRAERRHAYRNF